jgi:hypothetical protein
LDPKCNGTSALNLNSYLGRKCNVYCNLNLEVNKVQRSIVGYDLSAASDGTTVLYAFGGSTITIGTSPEAFAKAGVMTMTQRSQWSDYSRAVL